MVSVLFRELRLKALRTVSQGSLLDIKVLCFILGIKKELRELLG